MTPKRKSPGLAALLSVIPGLGHVYAGDTGKGLLLSLGTGLAGILMAVVPGVQFAFSGEWPGGASSPFGPPMTVAVTAPLFFVVVGPALVIYSMASAHALVVKNNAVIDGGPAGTGAGRGDSAPPGGWVTGPRQAALWGAVLTVLGLFLVVPAAAPGSLGPVLRFWPLLVIATGVAVIAGAAGRGRRGRNGTDGTEEGRSSAAPAVDSSPEGE
jgi:hypothetical protein